MKKRIINGILLALIVTSFVLSLVSCGDRGIDGLTVSYTVGDHQYNAEQDVTNIEVTFFTENTNSELTVSGYSHKFYFYDSSGALLTMREYKTYESIDPNDSTYNTVNFGEGYGFNASIDGCVSRVDVVPYSMNVTEGDGSSSSNDGGETDIWSIIGGIIAVVIVFNIIKGVFFD